MVKVLCGGLGIACLTP
ncbi:DUF3265 domain-containing protein [Vibrio parahaemolyticus]|nr:DUF3265 domain-containing protein [Vibrio parahaemolyticus]MDF5094010.1 DUF3265 domain-containing protein [Vibrio parahaemolyticus]MDF5094019.1 DUF3265 domain-containing protein [Vibrio parahaemolyticus]MDF5138984.1 DUF3265 domain-containing protein [Vibrio parahaemolyticus]MDF5138991.1 DUF3265 domain-containing protein [Vibrio parahaemolyticus]